MTAIVKIDNICGVRTAIEAENKFWFVVRTAIEAENKFWFVVFTVVEPKDKFCLVAYRALMVAINGYLWACTSNTPSN